MPLAHKFHLWEMEKTKTNPVPKGQNEQRVGAGILKFVI